MFPNLLSAPTSGISPDKKFVDKFRYFSLVKRASEEGMGPISVLLDKSNIVNRARFPIFEGMPPENS